MTYATGVLNSPTPAAALTTTLDAIIQAHDAWEFVEEVAVATDVARVYKCLGTENSWGTDFYVVLRRSSDTGNFGIELCEGYDAVNNLLLKYVPADSATVGVGSYTGLAADGSVGAIGKAHNDAGVAWGPVATTVNGDMPYFFSLTEDRMVLAIKEHGAWYAGLYESITDLSRDPAPLVLLYNDIHLRLGSSAQNQNYLVTPTTEASNIQGNIANPSAAATAAQYISGGYTRQLLVAAGNAARSNFMAILREWTPMNWGSLISWYSPTQTANFSNDQAEPLSGKWLPTRVALGHQSFSRHGGSSYAPEFRGWLRDVLALGMYNYAPVNGDEIVVDGVAYTRFGTGRLRFRDFWVPQSV